MCPHQGYNLHTLRHLLLLLLLSLSLCLHKHRDRNILMMICYLGCQLYSLLPLSLQVWESPESGQTHLHKHKQTHMSTDTRAHARTHTNTHINNMCTAPGEIPCSWGLCAVALRIGASAEGRVCGGLA